MICEWWLTAMISLPKKRFYWEQLRAGASREATWQGGGGMRQQTDVGRLESLGILGRKGFLQTHVQCASNVKWVLFGGFGIT